MATFRKKPVEVEAFQVPVEGIECLVPLWFISAVMNKTVVIDPAGGAFITTLEGTMRADVGDWIIRGIKGELYPCKPDIFAATYEAVEA